MDVVGIPDLPRTVDAVIGALPPLYRPEAWLALQNAQHPEEYAQVFERWWDRASRWMTPEQMRAQAAALEAGTSKSVPIKEMIERNPEIKVAWERAGSDPKRVREELRAQQAIRDQVRRERSRQYIARLEALLEQEKAYMAVYEADMKRTAG